jgi:formamidopyrimidine-DNA glycosylase
MPEIPDLQVIQEVLERRVRHASIAEVRVYRPLVLRVLDPAAPPEGWLTGRRIEAIGRHGKFLHWALDDGTWLVFNFMLAGCLRFPEPGERPRVRDYFALRLDDAAATELRFYDPEGMGKAYLTRDMAAIPGYAEQGPDALDPSWTPELWLERLKPHRGEIKGILTRGALVAGIGNAYADEILFAAGIYPFRKRTSLSREEQLAIYDAMHAVLGHAITVLRERMGDAIDHKIRDFLTVHMKKGQPCPRCGNTISEVRVSQRATNFCRRCQPGTLIRQ